MQELTTTNDPWRGGYAAMPPPGRGPGPSSLFTGPLAPRSRLPSAQPRPSAPVQLRLKGELACLAAAVT